GDVGRQRLVEQRRDLAEEVAAPGAVQRVPAERDGGLAVEDDVEARPAHAAPHDALTGGKAPFAVRVGDRLELGAVEGGEEGEAPESVDQVFAVAHSAPTLQVELAGGEIDDLGKGRERLDRVAQRRHPNLRTG